MFSSVISQEHRLWDSMVFALWILKSESVSQSKIFDIQQHPNPDTPWDCHRTAAPLTSLAPPQLIGKYTIHGVFGVSSYLLVFMALARPTPEPDDVPCETHHPLLSRPSHHDSVLRVREDSLHSPPRPHFHSGLEWQPRRPGEVFLRIHPGEVERQGMVFR